MLTKAQLAEQGKPGGASHRALEIMKALTGADPEAVVTTFADVLITKYGPTGAEEIADRISRAAHLEARKR